MKIHKDWLKDNIRSITIILWSLIAWQILNKIVDRADIKDPIIMAIAQSIIGIVLLFIGYLYGASKDKSQQQMDTISKTTSVSTTKEDSIK